MKSPLRSLPCNTKFQYGEKDQEVIRSSGPHEISALHPNPLLPLLGSAMGSCAENHRDWTGGLNTLGKPEPASYLPYSSINVRSHLPT